MSNTEDTNEHVRKGEPPEQQLKNEQATPLQQLLRFQSDIEWQGRQVAMAANSIAEAIDKGRNVSPEMISHVKAQILLAHLQLDDLERLLASLA
jgi:hypothetical protein